MAFGKCLTPRDAAGGFRRGLLTMAGMGQTRTERHKRIGMHVSVVMMQFKDKKSCKRET